MSKLENLRVEEVGAKVASLDKELDHWTQLTTREDNGLRRHHSQVQRLKTVLSGLTEPVRKSLENPKPASILSDAEDWENQILAAHSIWEVFRSKLTLREDELFRDVLAACDDLAYACYSPARDHFAPERKAPPLVYFTGTWSPFAISRDSGFLNELRGGDTNAALTRSAFFQVLARLPVPLVSLPWYDAFFLPCALSIAHEVAHVVEFDFELTGSISCALDAAKLRHAGEWKQWASEVFADLYGCLCLGPSFVGSMLSLLAAPFKKVTNESAGSGTHPPRSLRVELMLEALEETGHHGDVAGLRETWERTYGAHPFTDYQEDVGKVVTAIYQGPYKDKALTGIIGFAAGQEGALRTIGQAAAGGFKNYLEDIEPRVLFAGAQWLHENPQPNQRADAYQIIVGQIIKKGGKEFRSMRNEPLPDRAALDADLAATEALDRQTGRDLLNLLRGFNPQPPDPP